jgi:hypothetical protein
MGLVLLDALEVMSVVVVVSQVMLAIVLCILWLRP